MHIDPIFTYSNSEIALKVCRNKQRIKFNRRSLCGTNKKEPKEKGQSTSSRNLRICKSNYGFASF